jgi:hypothetical protein
MADTIITVKPTVISGRRLAHNKYDSVGRAFLAVDINSGAVVPTKFTMTQAARLARVSVTLAWWAKRRQAERAAIEAGLIPLVPPRLIVPKNDEMVADFVVLDFVRKVGIQKVLDAAVAIEAAQ